MLTTNIHPIGGYRYILLPWKGTNTCELLHLILNFKEIDIKESYLPYYLIIETSNIKKLIDDLRVLTEQQIIDNIVNLDKEEVEIKKFDRYIPEQLLKNAFVNDYLKIKTNLDEMKEFLD
ncbi:MAG: hypothetical protein ACFFD1_13270 [Candidatus Thorarchaeota archaeon]